MRAAARFGPESEMLDNSLVRSGVVHSVCPHDCPDRCSILSEVRDGRLVKVSGNPRHPVTQGFLCRKLAHAQRRVYAKDRLLYPLRRRGPKGVAAFERISWDQALATIGERWRRILAADSPYGILPFFGSGTEGLVHGHIAGRRFFNRLGALQLVRTICTSAGRRGYQYTMGDSAGADPMRIGECRLLVDWGVNSASTNLHHRAFLKQARAQGARYAVINSLAIPGAEGADFFLRPRPGSDAALALAMMRVIVDEELWDKAFVARHTVGFEALRERLGGYAPEAVESTTGIAAAEVRAFARAYARSQPAFIYVGPGCQRHSNAGMTLRTLACLPGLTGSWRYPGGGLYFPTSTGFPADFSTLEGEELRPNPPAGYNMLDLGRLLADRLVSSLYVFNGNPAAVLYNQNRLREGLAREDLFTVVHERYMTDTARFADIILPATTQFEQTDLLFSYYHHSLLLNRPAIAPLGECRSNLATFQALAKVMAFDEPCFEEDEATVIEAILALDQPALQGLDRDALAIEGWTPAMPDPLHEGFRRQHYPTPSGKIEFRSEAMAAAGLDPLPAYVPLKEGPERTPALFARYPLFFITPSGHSFLNANYAQDAGFRKSEQRPTVVLHPADAGARGIADGDLVRVFNDRGDCRLWAHLSEAVKPGVAAAAGQWWSKHYPDGGNANHTTPDFVADMGGGSAFNSNLVEIELAGQDAGVAGTTHGRATHAA